MWISYRGLPGGRLGHKLPNALIKRALRSLGEGHFDVRVGIVRGLVRAGQFPLPSVLALSF